MTDTTSLVTISEHRARVGRLGEVLAAQMLTRNGVRVSGHNVSVGKGELDLVATDGAERVAIEVKSGIVANDAHPRDHFTETKSRHVRELARRLGIHRIDLVTVVFRPDGVRLDWNPRV